MNCSRVLHALGAPPPRSMDLAVQLCLSQSQPLCRLLSMSSLRSSKALHETSDKDAYQPNRPGSQFFSSSSSSCSSCSSPSSSPPSSPYSSLTSEPRSCLRRRRGGGGGGGGRKRVVFADAVGLPLAAVRLFVPEPAKLSVHGTLPRVPHHPHHPQLLSPPAPSLGHPGELRHYRLKLASAPPPLDCSSGLKDAQVRLESCSVTERGLMGTVRVACGGGPAERAVHVRVTFDSWRSHRDVPCILLLQRCGNTETDVFAFNLPLPRALLDPADGVEFCVSVRVHGGSGVKVHWDDNRGQKYRVVCMEREDPQRTHTCSPQLQTLSPPCSSSSSSSSPHSSSSFLFSPTLDMNGYTLSRPPWSRQNGRQPDVSVPFS